MFTALLIGCLIALVVQACDQTAIDHSKNRAYAASEQRAEAARLQERRRHCVRLLAQRAGHDSPWCGR